MKDFTHNGHNPQRYGYDPKISYTNNKSASKPTSVVQKKSKTSGKQSTEQNQQGDALSRFFAMKAGTIPPPAATGMPEELKRKLEGLSGFYMGDVKVHYNSEKPAQLEAQAYTQGSDIYIAPGQEKHLPHEAWHVVQQKQGRVQPTAQFSGGVAVNTASGLEKEADEMGEKSLRAPVTTNPYLKMKSVAPGNPVIQLMKKEEEENGGGGFFQGVANLWRMCTTRTKPATRELPERTTIDRSNSALRMVGNYYKENLLSWTTITQNEFLLSLKVLVMEPSTCSQAEVGLCGFATACKLILEYNPEEFVRMAVSLYTTGKYEGAKITIHANTDLHSADMRGLSEVEFVVLPALRNEFNKFQKYDLEKKDDGSYDYEVSKFLKSMSFKKTTKEHWPTISKSYFKFFSNHFSEPSNHDAFVNGFIRALDARHSVLLSCYYDFLVGETTELKGQHVMQVTGVKKNSDGTIFIEYWTWGKVQLFNINVPIERFVKSTYWFGSFVYCGD